MENIFLDILITSFEKNAIFKIINYYEKTKLYK